MSGDLKIINYDRTNSISVVKEEEENVIKMENY
jgi:hypothetical protein